MKYGIGLALVWAMGVGCGPAQRPDPMLVADPPPTEDGSEPGAGVSDMDRGIAYIEKQAWEQALSHLERAVAAQESNAEAQYYYGLALGKVGRHGEAETHLEKAIALDENLHLARAHLGEIYLTGDNLRGKEAIAHLEPAAKAMPKDADIQQLLGFAYRVDKKYDESAKAYKASLAIEDRPQVRFDYADMLFEAEKMDAAVAEMRKLFPLFDKDVQVVAQLAHRFAKAKAFEDCVKAFDKAIALDKSQPAFYLHRGLCRHSLDESEDAVRKDYQKAIEIDPKFQAGWYYLGQSFLESKRRQQAVDAFKEAVKLGKGTPVGQKAQEKLDGMKK